MRASGQDDTTGWDPARGWLCALCGMRDGDALIPPRQVREIAVLLLLAGHDRRVQSLARRFENLSSIEIAAIRKAAALLSAI